MCLIAQHAHALERLAELDKQISPPLPPGTRKEVDSNYIFNVLNAVTPNATHIYISDNKYWLCSKQDIETFLSFDKTNKETYVPEEYDCDDFSYRLMGQFSIKNWSGIAFGIVWTNVHALNCLIDDTGKFYFVEPQRDFSSSLKESLEDWQGNEILFILM